MILLVSSIAFPPFYSVNLESRGTIDSLVLFPVYQSLLCVHHPEGRAFPCFSFFFFLLMLFLRKPWLTFLFQSAPDVTFLMIQLLAILPFCHFSWVDGIQFCWFESFLLLLPFLQLLVLVPQGTVPFALWEVTLGFSPFFLLDLWYLRRTYLLFVSSVFLVFSFELS